jgi:hypothetical protein
LEEKAGDMEEAGSFQSFRQRFGAGEKEEAGSFTSIASRYVAAWGEEEAGSFLPSIQFVLADLLLQLLASLRGLAGVLNGERRQGFVLLASLLLFVLKLAS